MRPLPRAGLSLLAASWLGMAAGACGGGATAPDHPPHVDAGAIDSATNSDTADERSDEWSTVRAQFGVLETIAGSGGATTGNMWVPAFENQPARAVQLSRPHFAMADASGNV